MKKIFLFALVLLVLPIAVQANPSSPKKEPKQEEFLPAIALGVAALLEAFTAEELALMGATLVTAGYAGTHTEETAKFVSSLGAATTTLTEGFETSRELAEEFSNGDGGKPDPGYRDDKWRRNAARAILCLKGLWVIDQILETYNLGNTKTSASLSEIYHDYNGELLADLENWKFLYFSQNNGIAICKIADGVYLTTSRNGTFILTVSSEGTHVVPARGFPGLEKVSEIESFLVSNQQIKNADERYEPIGPRSIQEILQSTEPFRPGEEQWLRSFLEEECDNGDCEKLKERVRNRLQRDWPHLFALKEQKIKGDQLWVKAQTENPILSAEELNCLKASTLEASKYASALIDDKENFSLIVETVTKKVARRSLLTGEEFAVTVLASQVDEKARVVLAFYKDFLLAEHPEQLVSIYNSTGYVNYIGPIMYDYYQTTRKEFDSVYSSYKNFMSYEDWEGTVKQESVVTSNNPLKEWLRKESAEMKKIYAKCDPVQKKDHVNKLRLRVLKLLYPFKYIN